MRGIRFAMALVAVLVILPGASQGCDPNSPLCDFHPLPNSPPVIWTQRGPIAPGRILVTLGAEITTVYNKVKPHSSVPDAVVVGPNPAKPVVVENSAQGSEPTAAASTTGCNDGASCYNAGERADYRGSINNSQLLLATVWSNIIPTGQTGNQKYDVWYEKSSAQGKSGKRIWALGHSAESRGVAQIVDWDPYGTKSTSDGQSVGVSISASIFSVSANFAAEGGKVSGGPPYDSFHGYSAAWYATTCCGSGDVVGLKNLVAFSQPSTSTTPFHVATVVYIG
jgi:hypothetical protein